MNAVRRILPLTHRAPAEFSHSPASDQYRRQARSLRSQYRARPDRLHASLRKLARDHDERHPIPPSVRNLPPALPLNASPVSVCTFVDEVNRALCDGLIRHSARRKLLKTAHRLAIPRFEANLLIAILQHRHDSLLPRSAEPRDDQRPRPSWTRALIVAGITQGLLLLGLYHWVL